MIKQCYIILQQSDSISMSSLLSCGGRKKKHPKFQLVEMFRQPKKATLKPKTQLLHVDPFAQELSNPIVSYHKIQNLAWKGIPPCIRPKIWKYLLKYVLVNDAEQILLKKRAQYRQLLKNYWRPNSFSQEEKKIFQIINADVKRIGSDFQLVCKSQSIQQMLKRLLFIWHNRHPASGYVQGMCDISMPFLIVFLGEYLPYSSQQVKFDPGPQTLNHQTLESVEADMYWCMNKLMEYVTSNYTQGFDGLRQAYTRMEALLGRIDSDLLQHFKHQKIDLFAVSFRSISTMLLRMFNANVGVRLFDTFISCEGSFPELMVCIFIAVVEKYAKKLMTMRFEELMGFLQNLPTRNWEVSDLEMAIAEAYCYQAIFSDNV